MIKVAQFIDHYRRLGAQAAQQQAGQAKHAGLSSLLPKSRMGKLGLGALGALGAGAAYKHTQQEPGLLESAYDGGKEMLGNMSQEDLMGYAAMLEQLQGGGGYSQGYAADELSPADYSLEDLGYPTNGYDTSGYEAQMSPEEAAQYYAYYNS
jgi:hypothetical protein